MASDIEREILDTLLDAFEKSRSFLGKNKGRQNFRISPSRLFPRYDDDSEFEFYKEVNASIASLEERGFIFSKAERSGKVTTIWLVQESIAPAYRYLGRSPRSDIHRQLLQTLDEFEGRCGSNHSVYVPLLSHIHEQRRRIAENKGILFFGDDLVEYTNLLTAVVSILGNSEELFVRELLVQLFKDSKKLEAMESKVRSFLHKYGEYDSRETALEEYNIVKTPTHVFVKGTGGGYGLWLED